MENQIVEVERTYNKEGFLVKLTANGVPVFIPKQDMPSIKINWRDVEWVSETTHMTREEAVQRGLIKS